MTSRSSTTPHTLARLLDSVLAPMDEGPSEAEKEQLQALLLRPRRFCHLFRHLLRAAVDAGTPSWALDYLADAAESDEQLDLLLAARGWRRPAEVLDPEGRRDVDYGQILAILEARLGRGEGDGELLGLVRRRLQEALWVSAGWEPVPSGSLASPDEPGPGAGHLSPASVLPPGTPADTPEHSPASKKHVPGQEGRPLPPWQLPIRPGPLPDPIVGRGAGPERQP